jgi:hypothetical protein
MAGRICGAGFDANCKPTPGRFHQTIQHFKDFVKILSLIIKDFDIVEDFDLCGLDRLRLFIFQQCRDGSFFLW